jgi:polyvinyl alcohol dehydrogenase (cytochrome)
MRDLRIKRNTWAFFGTGLILCWIAVPPIFAQQKVEEDKPPAGAITQKTFITKCMTCHGIGSSEGRAPTRETLMKLTPEAVYSALTTGPMVAQAKDLSDEEKRAMAAFLGGRPLGSTEAGDAKSMTNHCSSNVPLSDPAASPGWNGWGNDAGNTRFQPANAAGISADQVARLKLKWAFGFPNGVQTYGQPTVVSGRVFVASDIGYIYSLDAATGCVYWSYQAQTGVRTAIAVGPVKGQGSAKYAAYFGDGRANVYAVNAETGALLWVVQADDLPSAHITAAPTLYDGRLYVPISGGEEAISIDPHYPCCRFRGSVAALDANTGKQIWKRYVIPEPAKPTKKNSVGTQLYGPAGGAVWGSPTVDVKRRAVYVGTGDAYTEPAAKTTDSIIAYDMDTGKLLWTFQDTRKDAWMLGCGPTNMPEPCPKDLGPDWDYAASVMMRDLPNGHRVLVVAAKSGNVFGLDPDKKGTPLWKTALAEKKPGAAGLIVFGGSADERAAYYGLNLVGGMVALDLGTGERKWFTTLIPAETPGEPPRPGQSAAATAIPGVVFSGAWDGRLRAFSSEDGHILWEYNTVREYPTVNGVAAKGGSMGAPGPTVAGGMLFVGTGYIGVMGGMPGNALLAFSVE